MATSLAKRERENQMTPKDELSSMFIGLVFLVGGFFAVNEMLRNNHETNKSGETVQAGEKIDLKKFNIKEEKLIFCEPIKFLQECS